MIRAALAVAGLGLAGLLVYQWHEWPPTPVGAGLEGGATGASAGAAAPPADPLARLAPPEPRESYASVIERPLFRPQRKPEEAAGPEAEVSQEEEATSLKGVDLSAVVISPGVVSAWVRDPQAQELKRVRLGDDLQGWSVKEIQAERVVLERQGERDELILRDFSNTPPPAAPVPAPARPSHPVAQRPLRRPPPGGEAPGQPAKGGVRAPSDAVAHGEDQRVGPPVPPPPRANVRRPATPRSQ